MIKVKVTDSGVTFDPELKAFMESHNVATIDFSVECNPAFVGNASQLIGLVCETVYIQTGKSFLWDGVVHNPNTEDRMIDGKVQRMCNGLAFRSTYTE